jgi:hypothetical protein
MRAKQERENAALGIGCLGKAADDEPVFILRGQDRLAAPIVRLWAEMASRVGCSADKVKEAQELADAMDQWLIQKFPD